jgi:hypothetical protein
MDIEKILYLPNISENQCYLVIQIHPVMHMHNGRICVHTYLDVFTLFLIDNVHNY